jgi:hypothetical protein
MLIFNRFFFFFVILFSTNSYGESCDVIKKSVMQDKEYSEKNIEFLQRGVESDDLCLKNLMGIMLYKGEYFEKDESRAEAIFLDLSEKKYPEATFNTALVLSQKLDQNPNDVISLIIGVYYTYANDEKNSILATSAKNLGKNYVNTLIDKIKVCDKSNLCSRTLREMSDADAEEAKKKFNQAMLNAENNIASERLKFTNQTKEKLDNIMAIFTIGLSAYTLSSGINTNNSYRNNSNFNFINEQNPWINGNPLKHNLYQWPKPF